MVVGMGQGEWSVLCVPQYPTIVEVLTDIC